MEDFKLRPYQREVFDNLSKIEFRSALQWRRPRSVGIDAGADNGDHMVITRAYGGHNGKMLMVFDEWSHWPHYKWYRNPIKAFQWHRLMKNIRRNKSMAGTVAGGKAAAATNKLKYGADFYGKIGAKGGSRGKTGGFASGDAGRERARIYGAIGGRISRRPKKGEK